MVRIISDPDGEIISYELHPPFEYLSTLASSKTGVSEEGCGLEQVRYPLLPSGEPFTNDVERFFSMLRFDAREKLKDLPLE